MHSTSAVWASASSAKSSRASDVGSATVSGDALAGFSESTLKFEGATRPVFRGGTGPGVVVIHELPGIRPNVAPFGRRVIDARFSVWMESLHGQPGP